MYFNSLYSIGQGANTGVVLITVYVYAYYAVRNKGKRKAIGRVVRVNSNPLSTSLLGTIAAASLPTVLKGNCFGCPR